MRNVFISPRIDRNEVPYSRRCRELSGSFLSRNLCGLCSAEERSLVQSLEDEMNEVIAEMSGSSVLLYVIEIGAGWSGDVL